MGFSARPQTRSGQYRPAAEINVTPLVDVMLVLLVIFIITAPMLSTGLRVSLPKAGTAETLAARKPLVITVMPDGQLQLGAETVPLGELVARLRLHAGDDQAPVHLRADRAAAYGAVVAVIDALTAGGISRVAFVTGPAPKAEPGK